MLKQIEEMKELRIPSIVVSTKDDVLLLIGEGKYKLVFGRQQRTFWMQNSKTCSRSLWLRSATPCNTFEIYYQFSADNDM